MSGRKARQYRAARGRLATAALCDCGQYPHDFLTPCAFMAWCRDMSEQGFCAQCGHRLLRALDWDGRIGCMVRLVHCPSGCQRRMDWVAPEDATPAERAALGLVLRGEDSHEEER